MKTSTKFAISIFVVFILFPAIGYILIHKSMASANTELTGDRYNTGGTGYRRACCTWATFCFSSTI